MNAKQFSGKTDDRGHQNINDDSNAKTDSRRTGSANRNSPRSTTNNHRQKAPKNK